MQSSGATHMRQFRHCFAPPLTRPLPPGRGPGRITAAAAAAAPTVAPLPTGVDTFRRASHEPESTAIRDRMAEAISFVPCSNLRCLRIGTTVVQPPSRFSTDYNDTVGSSTINRPSFLSLSCCFRHSITAASTRYGSTTSTGSIHCLTRASARSAKAVTVID